jgi:hypothetical protein
MDAKSLWYYNWYHYGFKILGNQILVKYLKNEKIIFIQHITTIKMRNPQQPSICGKKDLLY